MIHYFPPFAAVFFFKAFEFGVVESSLPVVDFRLNFGSEGTPLLYVPTMESLLAIPN